MVRRRPGRGPRRQADGEIAVVGRKAIKARVDKGAAAVRAVHGLKPGVPLGAELWRRSTARLIAWLLGCSVARLLDCSIAWLLDCSIARC